VGVKISFGSAIADARSPSLFAVEPLKVISGEVVGQDGKMEIRRGPHAYRHPEIKFIGEQSAQEGSTKLQRLYHDIK
jgi:hypothetical protein